MSFVLDAAAQVFGERGYAATTNEIAARAGVSIGSLYQAAPRTPEVAERRRHALVVAVDAAVHEHVLVADTPEDEQARIDDVVTLTLATLAAYSAPTTLTARPRADTNNTSVDSPCHTGPRHYPMGGMAEWPIGPVAHHGCGVLPLG